MGGALYIRRIPIWRGSVCAEELKTCDFGYYLRIDTARNNRNRESPSGGSVDAILGRTRGDTSLFIFLSYSWW